ncbi:N-glycosylase/DNA lyase-like [Saccostrea cucullata]|uniref:N-glycosylase/DNA lyase-like n=1 Tax=Saccostrea cuccullata TaxID=36930 RepID=UPI002ED228BF
MPPKLEGNMSAPIYSGRILCHISEIRLERILASGQSFRWKEEKPGIWTGVLFDRIWRLWQSEAAISYQIFGNNKLKSEANEILPITKAVKAEVIKTCEGDIVLQQKGQVTTQSSNKTEGISDNMYADLMKDYFQLNVSVANLYKKWSEVDSNFQSISSKFEGIRTLRQDPVENLFSFICSSNNHISRISTMIEKLCENYGREVGQLDGKTYFSFPTVSEMADDGVESELRNLGFGYR